MATQNIFKTETMYIIGILKEYADIKIVYALVELSKRQHDLCRFELDCNGLIITYAAV